MLILYIHGFLSSPSSHKAQLVQAFCAQQSSPIEFQCPSLPAYPASAMSILEKSISENSHQAVGLIGSSLGGYYATYLAQRFQLPAVVINPAVKPYNLMANYLDQDLANYHTQEVSRLQAHHVEELRALELNRLQYPELIWLLTQTGDETLDYRQAVERYQDCKQTIEEGGDHSFQGFEGWLPEVIQFLKEH